MLPYKQSQNVRVYFNAEILEGLNKLIKKRNEHQIHSVQNLRRIFGPKGNEVTRGWRKLHNEKLHNLYSSPSTIRMIKSRRVRWVGHVARIGGGRGMHIGYWWESQKERDQ
jgi:hypothetical protein